MRLHLDPCQADDGPLRVVPATHHAGVLTPGDAQALRDAKGEIPCLADVGTALAMRPLLLHASSKSTSSRPRRVLHFVFGPATLPWGLAPDDARLKPVRPLVVQGGTGAAYGGKPQAA